MQADLQQPVELWGEDALLQWPGARRTLIQERDSYMARTIWAAASGTPNFLHSQDTWVIRQAILPSCDVHGTPTMWATGSEESGFIV